VKKKLDNDIGFLYNILCWVERGLANLLDPHGRQGVEIVDAP